MNSTKELLHQIRDPNISIDERMLLRCRLAKQLEEVGNYETAREAMGELWSGIGTDPNVEGLEQRTTAEVLLRAGTLSGWIGSIKQIESAQETAKNLISQSMAIFESLHERKKVAEAQTEIAVCYRREGALDEARVMFAEALTRLDDKDADLKAVTLLRSAVLEQLANRLNDALNILKSAALLFEASNNHTLKGRFHNEFAMVLRRLGALENRADYVDRALIEYSAASFHFEQAGHARYQACVENNLGFLFGTIRKFVKAHEHLDRAQALFTRLNDNVHLAQVEETRARVMVAEGEVAKAEKFARSAIRMLEKGGEQSLLAEALTTHGIVLAGLRKHDQARSTLHHAADLAERAGDLESAGVALVTLIEQLGHRLSNEELCATIERAGTLLEKCRDLTTIRRLERADRQVVFLTNAHPGPPEWSTFILEEVQQRNECRYVELALKDAHGSVTKAADLLGLRGHQSVNSILHRRCRHLLNLRTPIKPRRRRIIPTNFSFDSGHRDESRAARIAKILHVEDDEMVAGIAKEMLETQGWQIETCSDGNIALEKISGETYYDLLLVDYDLPGVNGIELVHRARQLAHRSRTPIIVLSATPVDAAAREAGADAFLPKPQGVSSVVETITRLLDEREQEV